MRDSAHQGRSELLCCFETEITTVDVVGKSEGELAMVEVVRLDFFVVYRLQRRVIASLHLVVAQPLEKQVRWEHLIIEYLKSITIEVKFSQTRRWFDHGLVCNCLSFFDLVQINLVVILFVNNFHGLISYLINLHARQQILSI